MTAGEPGHWIDDEAGPVVRPYALTQGRTTPVAGIFNLISLVIARSREDVQLDELKPEHLMIMELCRKVLSVAEIAAYLGRPAGTVRVLLGDLLIRELVEVWEPPSADARHHGDILEKVLNGLRGL